MKITRVVNPINIFHPADEELPLEQWVEIKHRFRNRLRDVKIGELGLYIGDKVKFEKGTKGEYVVKK